MSKYALQLKNISMTYRDGNRENQVLDNVSLEVEQGEVVAIVGPSGSGKTSLLSIAGVLLSPTAGEIIIGDKKIHSKNKKEWVNIRANQIGFIFQAHQLIPFLNVQDQLEYMKNIASTKDNKFDVQAILKELGLSDLGTYYPSQLSGGEKQRVAIARAFVNQPDIILADEPTASLDSKRGRQVMEIFRNMAKKYGKAAVIVTHDERLLDLVDTIYTIDDGKLMKVNGSK